MTPESMLLLAWLDEAEAPTWVADGVADALPKIEAACADAMTDVSRIMKRHTHYGQPPGPSWVMSRFAGRETQRYCLLCRALVAAGVLTVDDIGSGTRAAIISGRRPWEEWEAEVTDGWTILDPDGFRHGKPTVVTKDEFERARLECTLIRDESRAQYGLPPRAALAHLDLLEVRTERDGLFRDFRSALADLRAAEAALGRVEALATEWESGEYEQDMGSEGRHVLMVTARRLRLALAPLLLEDPR